MDLKDWFKEKEYATGLAILAQHSKNRILLQNLSRKRNPSKLEYELKKLLASSTKATSKKAKSKKNAPVIISLSGVLKEERKIIVRNNREVKYDELPERLQKVWDNNRDSFKKIRALHEKLKNMENATADERAPLTQEIATLDQKIRDNFKIIDAWKPGEETEVSKINHKRINANRKYISVNVAKLSNPDNNLSAEKIEDLREKLQERVNELLSANEELAEATLAELRNLGVKC